MKRYKEFTVTAEPFNPEILSSILWELNLDGITEDVNCLRIYTNEKSGISIRDVENELQKLADQKMLFKFNVQEMIIEDKNWNKEWEQSVNVIKVSDKIVIKPTFREYEAKKNEIVITIDPKMSFGTGEHQTTKLILNLLEKYIKLGGKVLDVGSGTAVLAIAALKLGASNAAAVDNDEWCYDNSKENAALNNVEDKIEIRIGEIKDIEEKEFDLITANIQKNVLIDISKEILDHLKQDGVVLLSGLLDTDEKDILTIYENTGFKFIEKTQMDEWIAMVFRKFKD